MDTYILYRGSKRLTFKQEDMQVEKITRIFQVTGSSLYLTDDANVAIFPGEPGYFSAIDLVYRSHYEVHGESEITTTTTTTPPITPTSGPGRFTFSSLPSASASSAFACSTPRASTVKSWTRAISIGEVQNGKPVAVSVVTVRFTEMEANVPSIIEKVMLGLKTTESLVLTDANWCEVLDTEGTRGSMYWKQNSRKINAMSHSVFIRLRRKRTRDDNSGLQEVLDKVEEVLEASQGLEAVANQMRELSTLVTRDSINIPCPQATHLKESFTCMICREIMDEPMLSGCCRSLLGCRACFDEWALTSTQCPKCRADCPLETLIQVAGLSTALAVIKDL